MAARLERAILKVVCSRGLRPPGPGSQECTERCAFAPHRHDGRRPLLSNHFNLTIEFPLKVTVRGCSWTVVPTSWYGQEAGESKFLIKAIGSRYVHIILHAFIEKYFSRGDYRRSGAP
jgi:hypothetical protein